MSRESGLISGVLSFLGEMLSIPLGFGGSTVSVRLRVLGFVVWVAGRLELDFGSIRPVAFTSPVVGVGFRLDRFL